MKAKTILFILIAVIFLVGANFYINKSTKISGKAISDLNIKNLNFQGVITTIESYDIQTLIFIGQWLLVGLIILIFAIKLFKKRKLRGKTKIISRKEGGAKTHTDLDNLYELLNKNQTLRISEISKAFKINNEKSLEWCKILEGENLAIIDYPAFSEPEVKIKKEEEEDDKEKDNKESDEKTKEKAREKKERKEIKKYQKQRKKELKKRKKQEKKRKKAEKRIKGK